jgi:hypothetical protein
MYVLDDVSFICHPNTGSRSLRAALRKLNAEEVLGHHQVCAKRAAQTRACVCVVRNPYDIMASWYCRMPATITLFEVWLANTLQGDRHHEGPQPCGLFYGLNWATDVVRFEDLPGSLNVVTEKLGLPRLILGQKGVSGRTSADYRAMYNDKSKLLVRAAYCHQIRACNYDF